MKAIFSWAAEIALLVGAYSLFDLPGLIITGFVSIGIVTGARWKATQQMNAALLEAKTAVATWTRDDQDVDRSLDFKTMILTCDAHPHWVDGDVLYQMDKELEESWSAEREEDGWTKADWKDRGLSQYEVRRTPEGVWQSRLTYKHWSKQAELIRKRMETGGATTVFGEDRFKELHGLTWEQFLNRDKEPLPDVDQRPWENVDDAFAPSIETAYQRYIHQG